jgi:hypothetical protein
MDKPPFYFRFKNFSTNIRTKYRAYSLKIRTNKNNPSPAGKLLRKGFGEGTFPEKFLPQSLY